MVLWDTAIILHGNYRCFPWLQQLLIHLIYAPIRMIKGGRYERKGWKWRLMYFKKNVPFDMNTTSHDDFLGQYTGCPKHTYISLICCFEQNRHQRFSFQLFYFDLKDWAVSNSSRENFQSKTRSSGHSLKGNNSNCVRNFAWLTWPRVR